MHKMEFFILDILQNKLYIDNDNVRLIQAPPQYNNIPCLTIDNSAGSSLLNQNKTNIKVNGEPTEVIESVYDVDIRIDIWCLNEDDRQSLIEQVQDCFLKAMSDHYTYCTAYMNDSCECVVNNTEYEFDKRASKKQCPCPHDLPYENLFTKYNIDLNTFNLSLPYDMDDLNEKEPILRSRFDLRFEFTDYYIIGGIVSDNLIYNGE